MFHLAVYSDAPTLGGAEVNLSRVLGALPDPIHVTVVGVDDDVVDWLARHRPGTDRLVLPAVVDKSDVRGLLRHRAMFRRLRADLLQFNLSTASSCQWAILAASTIPGLPLVVIENSPMGVWSSTSGRLKRATAKRLAAHIAVGDRTGRLIEASSELPPNSIETIYHGVPDVRREPAERPDEPTLLTVARHDPVKGVDVLLDAFVDVPAPTRLVLIGDGAETASLHRRCTELGLDDRVEFRPMPWDGVRVADVMWNFDGLVLPSRLEGFPVTIAEAMLAGSRSWPPMSAPCAKPSSRAHRLDRGARGPRRARRSDGRARRRPRPRPGLRRDRSAPGRAALHHRGDHRRRTWTSTAGSCPTPPSEQPTQIWPVQIWPVEIWPVQIWPVQIW